MRRVRCFHLFMLFFLASYLHCYSSGFTKDTVYEDGFFNPDFRDTAQFANDTSIHTTQACSVHVFIASGNRLSLGVQFSRNSVTYTGDIYNGTVRFWTPGIYWNTSPDSRDRFTGFKLDRVVYPTKLLRMEASPETISVGIVFWTSKAFSDTLFVMGRYTDQPIAPNISVSTAARPLRPSLPEYVYSVSGRRSCSRQNPIRSGVYFRIQNGKKIVKGF